ncbi:flavoprotein [Saccharothrix violaceirubra]|uniref:Phosphopantothenoylcysteine synthetase/decarboxylase n=1 Tax=Saccharothrix violaceirubra TaxID=413306 RepID=A0A7W7T122_9PSEU|nr:flavoprotein [Saccharothrix violaceirubra]MBB4964619.1 phosphopantothenoylcysteine synthetase/decarboxylase [Saccharothrix violaceirubra]
MTRPVLALIASAGGGVEHWFVPELARPLAEEGWRLAVTVTPTAARWLEPLVPDLEALTDLPVRSTSRLPGEPRPHPPADAFVLAPGTANSVAKLALGIADNQALTVLCEGLGRRAPMVVLVRANDDQLAHPAFDGHLAVLRTAGVRLVSTGGPSAVRRELTAARRP